MFTVGNEIIASYNFSLIAYTVICTFECSPFYFFVFSSLIVVVEFMITQMVTM